MMNYAPGADAPRKVHSQDVEPAPPGSAPTGVNRTSSDGIDYSDSNTRASRRGLGNYFDLDPDTKLPVPLDAGGFFRVSPSDTSPEGVKVAYRIKKPFIGAFPMLKFSSTEINSFIILAPVDRELSHEDILSASLELMERRKSHIENSSNSDKRISSIDRLCGDYPPKKAHA